MENILSDLTALVVPFAKNLIVALLVFIVGFKVVNFIIKKMKNSKGFNKIDPSAASFIASFISIALKIIVVVSVISILGVPMSSVVALVASAGVAIGLAVQGALSNLVGGIMILFFKPFRVGDYIEAEGVSGTVRDISVFYTIILTIDNKVITVPNGSLTNSVISNYSSEKLRRVDIEITADYNSDITVVKNTMMSVVSKCPNALNDPEPCAVMSECCDNGIKYILRVWCDSENYWDVRFCLLEGIRNAFKDSDIEIPYPQMDVHVKKD